MADMEILAISCILTAVIALLWMGWIDLKLWILPNELVILLALSALPFHFALDWIYGGFLIFIFGAIIGGGSLWGIRAAANRIYGFETMGLGDVKLMAAVGLWLGPQSVLMALSVGAFCGVLHAVILALKLKKPLNRMMLPAGPGFIAGAIIVGIYKFGERLL
jgi:leader peptidase (prepilin peptidase) / N-methyltransferase